MARFLCIVTILSCATQTVTGIWPMPRTIANGTSSLKLAQNFSIELALSSDVPQDLMAAVADTKLHLKHDTFERLVVGRGAADAIPVSHAAELPSLRLTLAAQAQLRSIATEATVPLPDRNEFYELSVPHDGSQATLVANSSLGLFRGLTTFGLLWYSYMSEKYILNAPLNIADGPAFPYRGFSLDTSRNFFPVSDVLRTVEAMSWVKLNILYWHAVDSHSFPLEVTAFPDLAKKGAYSGSEIYSSYDVQQIISYANARGIDVILELDSPGHTAAISAAFPDHIACANKSPWSNYASEPPAGQLRIASNATLNFARELFDSSASTFNGTMMSSGGDEVNLPCWEEDEETVADLAALNITIGQALNTFIQEVQGVIKSHGKRPLIKSDMILAHNVTVTNDTIAVVWQSSADAVDMARLGHSFIHQPADYFYLDCGGGGWLGDDVLLNSWCDPFKTWQRAYSFDPLANLTTDQHHLVQGGQMPLWTEQSSPENLDPVTWPRLASAAEVFWTGSMLPGGISRLGANFTSGSKAFARMHELRYRLVDRGIKAIALQPHWCAVRGSDCDLNA